ncbi:expressed unknown protein [Seminavis robusta]|uniref:DUF6824 domain-containing protein n=1 Tax=Seminavis robusta TaxID=568900 RepID=A0A9N8E4T8_9STRA|nr:expressed unknown protein [Seminavis robusta]|eukprot:Sro652_g181690.1 n/a (559) ;mRNA; r:9062-11321
MDQESGNNSNPTDPNGQQQQVRGLLKLLAVQILQLVAEDPSHRDTDAMICLLKDLVLNAVPIVEDPDSTQGSATVQDSQPSACQTGTIQNSQPVILVGNASDTMMKPSNMMPRAMDASPEQPPPERQQAVNDVMDRIRAILTGNQSMRDQGQTSQPSPAIQPQQPPPAIQPQQPSSQQPGQQPTYENSHLEIANFLGQLQSQQSAQQQQQQPAKQQYFQPPTHQQPAQQYAQPQVQHNAQPQAQQQYQPQAQQQTTQQYAQPQYQQHAVQQYSQPQTQQQPFQQQQHSQHQQQYQQQYQQPPAQQQQTFQQQQYSQAQQPQQNPALNSIMSLLQDAGVQGANGAAVANGYPMVPQQQHEIREVHVPHSYPMINIEFPGPHDVVLGRGRGASCHIGNIKFRAFIKKYKPKYAAANRVDKPKVAEEVVGKWRRKNPPGRFLEQTQVGDRNIWNDVGDRKARQKSSQSLREKELPPPKKKEDNNEDQCDSSSVELGEGPEIEEVRSSGSNGEQERSSSGSEQGPASAGSSGGEEQVTQGKVSRVSEGSSSSSGAGSASDGA